MGKEEQVRKGKREGGREERTIVGGHEGQKQYCINNTTPIYMYIYTYIYMCMYMFMYIYMYM